ncbi:hypothetical protein DP113_15290 [Brasilonema octagenarum UFV-E1]|uniref:DUF1822 family protein n=1 Tax=Brasilonema sennae CENA114 TaxID=415709 RepID=A0A856MD37_9CYAN|nr:DUF1822 family protein [Brasilonema sennae]QDL09093.1 hypothetical protein DP114_15350 [Brasilonema sennae CENA114]QDL15451.1 hypothetical protein DP113_15290 [Brasilonema octagenarum UFV-E1]
MSSTSQYISVPLDKNAHCYAEEFAAEQATPEKGKQVYLNTLAVYAVHSYLKCLGIETDLTGSDSWHPGLRALLNVADLVLPNVGKLECRPVLPGERTLKIPLEVTQDGLGYVAVEFHDSLNSVQLLGFAPTMTSDEPPEEPDLEQLQSLVTLIETIHMVNLRQWLEGIFKQNWQAPELVLAGNSKRTLNFKSIQINNSTSRAKVMTLAGHPLVLVVQLTPKNTEEINIRLRLYPGNNVSYLPQDLQIILFDQAGTACMEAQTRSTNDCIQLEFGCQLGEKFSINVILKKTSLTEKFVI